MEKENLKNINIINKIITILAHRDMRSHREKWEKSHKKKFDRKGNPIQYPGGYSLSVETMEAMEIRDDYLSGKITDEEYKGYCLKKRIILGI